MVFMNFSSKCPLYPDEPKYCDVTIAIKRSVGVLSIIGCLFVLILIWIFKKYQSFTQRMIMMLALSALLDSITYVASDIYPAGFRCSLQAAAMTYFDWSTLLWVCAITLNLWFIAIHHMNKQHWEKWYHAVCWGVPLIFTVIPLAAGRFGPAGVWCWINDKSTNWRLGIWYVPLYILVFVMLVSNGYIAIRMKRQAQEWSGGYDSCEQREKDQLEKEGWQLLAYPFIYLILSVPPFIYRLHNSVHHDRLTNFPLLVGTVLTGPALGACNAVRFALDGETRSRLNCTEIKRAIKSHDPTSSVQVIPNYSVPDATPMGSDLEVTSATSNSSANSAQ